MASKGFTLLELLVVLALVALALTLVPPMFSRGVPRAELEAAARQVADGLREGRGRAIAGNAEVAVTVDVEAHSLRVGEAAARALPPALTLTLVTAESERLDEHRGAIRFFPDGGSTGGRVSLSLGDRSRDVTVDWLTGRVSRAR